MAPQCIICQTEILTTSRAEKLRSKLPKLSSIQKKNVEDELAKGFMVSTYPCGHCFHEMCLLRWVKAEHQTKCFEALEDMYFQCMENGDPEPTLDQVREMVESMNYHFRCPICRNMSDPDNTHRIFLCEDKSESGSVSGRSQSTSTPSRNGSEALESSLRQANQRIWDLTTELKESQENEAFLNAILENIGMLRTAEITGSARIRERQIQASTSTGLTFDEMDNQSDCAASSSVASSSRRSRSTSTASSRKISAFEQEVRRRMQSSNLRRGSIVTYIGSNQVPIVGVIKWCGRVNDLDQVECFGIEFAEPIGDFSGQIGNKVLFDCKPCHGYLSTVNALHEDKRFRFDDTTYNGSYGLQVVQAEGGLKVGSKVVWLKDDVEAPQVGMVKWLGFVGKPGDSHYMAGVEFANKIGHPEFKLFPHRIGHARLVEICHLLLFKDYFPLQDDLAALNPKVALAF